MIFVLPFFLGALSVLSFQPFNYTIINFLILPALFLNLSHVRKKSKNIYRKKPFIRNIFFIGYSFGVGFFLSGNYWITYSLTFDESFKYLIPISLIGIPLFLGLFFGLATLISGIFIKNNFISILLFCNSLSLVDFLRSKILTGFPWNLWAYSWSWFPEIIQVLNPIGLFAFNMLSITFFCIPLVLIFKKNKLNMFIFCICLILFFLNYIFGSMIINKNNISSNNSNYKNNTIYTKVISPNFDIKYNLSLNDVSLLLKKLIKFSQPEKNKETIFIWPEGVFTGFYFSELSEFKSFFKSSFSDKHIIIFGINTQSKTSKEYYNSLVAVNNNFEIIYQYNKKKLVPFGEFLPLEDILKKLGLKKITQGYGSFSEGKNVDNFIMGNLNALPLICYEIIFPQLTQGINNKTNMIINISEDGWFGKYIGPRQHFAKAIFRAVESNTFLIRSANQGVSAFIDNRGNVIKHLDPNERGSIELNVPLVNNNSKNRNDLIFFILLFTYTLIILTFKKNKNDR